MTNPIDKAQPEALRLAAALATESDAESHGVKYSTAKKAAAELRRLHAELERTERNRDMWKEQVATQAAQIEACRAEAALGRIAMQFVDRAGDVHPGIDDAEKICADFYAAMCTELDQRAITRASASIGAKGGDEHAQ